MKIPEFGGGIYPPHYKELTHSLPIKEAGLPQRVVLPLSQHAGAPAIAVVRKGDYVRTGQVIGEPQGRISAYLHSSVSGRVVDIVPRPHPVINRPVLSVIIESDGKDAREEQVKTHWDYFRYSPGDIRKVIETAGVVGMGGAAFPTHVKLAPPSEIDTLILNGCECEPYITSDDRLMQEYSKEIVEGMKLFMFILNVHKGLIVIEDNKEEAIDIINKIVFNEPNISVVRVKTHYPQGSEKQLIKAVLNRTVPSGKLPFHVGVVVQNVATSYAVHQAVVRANPLISRVVSVTASESIRRRLHRPGNYLVRIGMTLSDLLAQCEYESQPDDRVVCGGPMMGVSQYTLSVPVIKGTSGVVLLEGIPYYEHYPCIKCGRCVSVCPMGLMPNMLSVYAEAELWQKAKEFYPQDCTECGCCSYVCPAKRPIVQHIKLAKE
ncbi:MAG: electron transport complex subunit RsxC [Elusimicrobiota bacterium]